MDECKPLPGGNGGAPPPLPGAPTAAAPAGEGSEEEGMKGAAAAEAPGGAPGGGRGPGGRGLHTFTSELNLSNSRTHS